MYFVNSILTHMFHNLGFNTYILWTLVFLKLGFNWNYHTLTSILLIKIVLCSKFSWTKIMIYVFRYDIGPPTKELTWGQIELWRANWEIFQRTPRKSLLHARDMRRDFTGLTYEMCDLICLFGRNGCRTPGNKPHNRAEFQSAATSTFSEPVPPKCSARIAGFPQTCNMAGLSPFYDEKLDGLKVPTPGPSWGYFKSLFTRELVNFWQ